MIALDSYNDAGLSFGAGTIREADRRVKAAPPSVKNDSGGYCYSAVYAYRPWAEFSDVKDAMRTRDFCAHRRRFSFIRLARWNMPSSPWCSVP